VFTTVGVHILVSHTNSCNGQKQPQAAFHLT
jgi:hypothetical protein